MRFPVEGPVELQYIRGTMLGRIRDVGEDILIAHCDVLILMFFVTLSTG